MIVEPGFFHHWKTLRLIELTGEAAAPLMILRLWGYCHSARMWKFREMADEKLAGICGWKGDPQEFRSTMIKCGFLELQGPFLTVHEWDKYNRKLISCWRNGKKGGRYCKTQQEPNANPIQPTPTHANPSNLVLSNQSVQKNGTGTVPEQDWIKSLKASPAYNGIDVEREYHKMVEWYKVHKKRPTKQRFINWLNKQDVPLLEIKKPQKEPLW